MAKTATVEYRNPHPDGGSLTVWTSSVNLVPVAEFLDDSSIVLFRDELTDAFVGLETDYPQGVSRDAERLRALPLEHLNVPTAGLRDIHPAEALLWGFKHLFPAVKCTLSELQARLATTNPNDLPQLQAMYYDVMHLVVPVDNAQRAFVDELMKKIGAAFKTRKPSS